MAKYIHATDLHGDISVLEHIANSCDNVDAVFLTGDFNGGNNGLNALRNPERLIKKNKGQYQAEFFKHVGVSPEKISELKPEEQEKLGSELKQYVINRGYIDGLTDFKKPLEQIAQKTKIFGVTGNHDFYTIKDEKMGLGKYITFLDDTPAEQVGNQTIQGFNNSYEMTHGFSNLVPGVEKGVPFYLAGLPTKNKAEELNCLENIEKTYEGYGVTEEDVIKAQNYERNRLGNGKTDISLMHKSRQVKKFGMSDVADELFDRTTKFALVGHVHAPFVGYVNGTLEINPGQNNYAEITTNEEGYATNVKLYKVN